MNTFNEDKEGNLLRLQKELQTETFDARAVRRVYIPKSDGKVRPLGIPSIRDRVVQEAIRMILEPIYEADFSQYSFGFRPNRCTMDAIKCVLWSTQENKKCFWVIEGDISSYFDTINHRRLRPFGKNEPMACKLLLCSSESNLPIGRRTCHETPCE
jgi:retron-type reverse transcriptase